MSEQPFYITGNNKGLYEFIKRIGNVYDNIEVKYNIKNKTLLFTYYSS